MQRKNYASTSQAAPRQPAAPTAPHQPATTAAPAPVSYTVIFEATMAAVREEQGTPP